MGGAGNHPAVLVDRYLGVFARADTRASSDHFEGQRSGTQDNGSVRHQLPHAIVVDRALLNTDKQPSVRQFTLGFLCLGNGYLERRRSMLGLVREQVPPLAKYMRSGKDGRQFMVHGWKEEHEFEPGTVFHLREADLHQEVYGLPEWISALQSALLNESATLFRRKYYENGSHASFILYMNDAAQNEADVDSLRKALKDSKGPGNFRNLFVYSPNGKKDGLQIIPVSEVTAKDEFNSIKNQTRDDVLASLRIPPQLMGIVPQNAGGFGSIREAAQIYAANELEPIQARMAQVNDWLGEEVMRFKPYELAPAV